MERAVGAVRNSGEAPAFHAEAKAVNRHHNDVAREEQFGENVLVAHEGAVRTAPARS